MTPSEVGARAELAIATALVAAGNSVYLPFFNPYGRVDLVYADSAGTLKRMQCKTSYLKDGCVAFRTCSNTGNVPVSYAGEVDVFGVYSPELDCVFIVPVDDAPTRRCFLRVAPPRNGQAKTVRWAEPYRLTPVGA
ncbi:MAG TPA: group I intron-associated PD-(D/E)XK endonuclease [Acidimicrobiales bacterium]|nr:group I intron-associated PD-(D/E)XK endonuclease [Acidimicrobiales bacterium]